jgi:lipopolysaccharide export system permease protein
MFTNTLARYFARQYIGASLAVFAGIFVLVVLIDYIEMTRKTAGIASASALLIAQTSLYRVPQLLERLMPFSVQVGAMACYLTLSRRLELVVARAAGVSAWQIVAPALTCALVFGSLATTVYNPLSATLAERAKRMETELMGDRGGGLQDASGFWVNQVTSEGQSIINAASSRAEGTLLLGISIFRLTPDGRLKDRIEAREAQLEGGHWLLKDVHRYSLNEPVVNEDTYVLPTGLTREQVRDTFSTPETVSFWQLPEYIASSEHSGITSARYRLQYHKLIALPFLLAAMVLLASSVSLRLFRLGGVQKMIIGGMLAGFLLYVLQKITEDLSKADLMNPMVAAWLPVCVGSLTGLLAMLYQEDG